MLGDESTVIYLTDMSRCTPSSALSTRRRKDHWQLVEYEAEDVSGVMLCAGPETDAPPVTLPLNLKGWYAIHIGVWGEPWSGDTALKVKLSDDPCFITIIREDLDYFTLDERFWKYADLTGQDLIFGQQKAGFKRTAFAAYVKLVPLSEAEVTAIQNDRQRTDTKRLIAMNDGFSFFGERHPTTAEEIWEWIEPYRDTDFQKLYWGIGNGGSNCSYPSKIASVIGKGVEDYPRVVDRYVAQSVRSLLDQGIDPLKVALEFARRLGLEFHISVRMGAHAMSPPFEEFFTGRLYREHPEWHCVDRDGTPVARISYAFPEVQDYVLSILREVAEYSPDGVNLIFNRGAPFLLYEEPLVDGFLREYGQDPRELGERDERWLRYRARTMTEFMRAVRRTMNEVGEKPLEVSAHVLNTEAVNLFYGLDLATWIEEELIDVLVPYPWRNQEIAIEDFARLTGGKSCLLYPEMMPRRMSPEEYRQKAMAMYAAGADGLCFWDTNGRDPLKAQWSMVRRLGHREELAGWEREAQTWFQSRKLYRLGGYTVDRYPPHWAY